MYIVDMWENKSESGTSGRVQSKHGGSNWVKVGKSERVEVNSCSSQEAKGSKSVGNQIVWNL